MRKFGVRELALVFLGPSFDTELADLTANKLRVRDKCGSEDTSRILSKGVN
jgi:hypothetical protein